MVIQGVRVSILLRVKSKSLGVYPHWFRSRNGNGYLVHGRDSSYQLVAQTKRPLHMLNYQTSAGLHQYICFLILECIYSTLFGERD